MTLPTSCSLSEPLLSRQNATLALLGSVLNRELVIWIESFVCFLFANEGLDFLANSSFCGDETILSIQQIQWDQVFLPKPSLFRKRSADLNPLFSVNSDSRYVLNLLLSPLTFFSFTLSGKSGRNFSLFLFLLSDYNGFTAITFFLMTTRPTTLPDKVCCFNHLVFPSLTPRPVSTFFWTGGQQSY